jgi:hypothetical protein
MTSAPLLANQPAGPAPTAVQIYLKIQENLVRLRSLVDTPRVIAPIQSRLNDALPFLDL